MSQSDIDDRSGLPRTHVSLIENGHPTPWLPVPERSANALDVRLHELLNVEDCQPEATAFQERSPVGAQERTLLGLFGKMLVEDRALLISLARDMVKRKGNRG